MAELLKTVLPQLGEVYAGIDMQLDDAAWVGYRLAEILPIAAAEKQFCLELDDPIQRLDVLESPGLAGVQLTRSLPLLATGGRHPDGASQPKRGGDERPQGSSQ